MITQIGIVAGNILTFLEQKNGLVGFNDIKFSSNDSDYLILMSLGWLCREGYIDVIENLSSAGRKNDASGKAFQRTILVVDPVVWPEFKGNLKENMSSIMQRVAAISDQTLHILEDYQGMVAFRTLERNLNESRDVVLMGMGWLIREGYIRGIIGARDIFVFGLHKELHGSPKVQIEERQKEYAHVFTMDERQTKEVNVV